MANAKVTSKHPKLCLRPKTRYVKQYRLYLNRDFEGISKNGKKFNFMERALLRKIPTIGKAKKAADNYIMKFKDGDELYIPKYYIDIYLLESKQIDKFTKID